MKNRFKKIGSLLAACAVLTSSFTISAFAGSEESAIDSTREYLLREDFSDFKNGVNGSANNRLDQWRIEGGTDWNGNLSDDYLSVVDKDTMKGALKLGGEGFATNGIIRGGRDWTSDKYIHPGETAVIEFDIYADASSKFIFGIHSDKNNWYAEEPAGQSAFMFLKPNDEEVYFFTDQGRNDNTTCTISGVTVKRGEVNHVRAEYALNSDISLKTNDTLTMTVTNSAGTFTGSAKPGYRYSDNNFTVTGIRGINFFKDGADGNVYLDNIEVYKDNVLLEDDFTTLKNGGNGSDNNRLDQWRIEGGTGWNDNLSETFLSITDKGSMKSALRMGGTGFATDGIIRGGRRFGENITAGQSYAVEFDIYADTGAEFSIGQHSVEENSNSEDNACHSYFFHLKPKDKSNDETLWYHSDQSSNVNPTLSIPNVVFKRNEVNHVKIEYTFNEDVSYLTKDAMTITVDNSAGKTSGTVNVNYRFTYNGYTIKPLTGTQGITFFKWKSNPETEIYLDNLKVYRTNVTYTAPTAESKAADSVTVNFGKAVNSVADGKVYIFSNGAKVEATGALSDDKTSYTLSGASLTAGKEYQVVVANGLTAADGSLVKASKLTFAPANGTTTVTKDQTTIDPTADLNVSITAATDKVGKGVIVCVASYEDGGKLAGVKMQKATLTAATKTVKFDKNTIAAADSYKIFVWDAVSGEPICNNL